MIRECSLEDISDGRTYGLNDMVKADTGNCEGCYQCCTGMGNSIVLDPYDVWLLKVRLQKRFQDLLDGGEIELNMVDGLILPNLRMGERDRCSFLRPNLQTDEARGTDCAKTAAYRCGIYEFRPGLCRLFPLGRVYEGKEFQYFLQKDACKRTGRAKVKVKKWIDTGHIEENQRFILDWHGFIRETGDKMKALKRSGRGDILNELAMYVLNEFYVADLIYAEDACLDNIRADTPEQLNQTEIYGCLAQKLTVARENIRALSRDG